MSDDGRYLNHCVCEAAMAKAIICEHGLTLRQCAPCRAVRGTVKLCEHGIPAYKCVPCSKARKAKLYQDNRERYLVDMAIRRKRVPCTYKRSDEAKEKKLEQDRAYSHIRYKLNAEAICKAQAVRNRANGHAAAKRYYDKNPEKMRVKKQMQWARRWARDNAIPYSIFFRCKHCKRSTPSVNRYCDDEVCQDIHAKWQEVREYYRLNKLRKKEVHHVRYQECNHE